MPQTVTAIILSVFAQLAYFLHMQVFKLGRFCWRSAKKPLGIVTRFFLQTKTPFLSPAQQCQNSLTHCCARPARAVATSTTNDPALMTTASRLRIRDPLPPVVSRSSLAGQVDASSRGQGICPARGWHSAGGCCGMAHLVVGGKHVLAMSVFCQLWWDIDPFDHVSKHMVQNIYLNNNTPPPCKFTLTFWYWKWCPSCVWRGLNIHPI